MKSNLKQKLTHRQKRLAALFMAIFLLALLFGSMFFTVSCSGDRTFIKYWAGEVCSVVGNVVIKDTAGVTYWNDKIPADNRIVISNLPHGISLRITWTDWRGPQQEVVCVECKDGVETKCNYIPPPPPPTSKLEQET